MEIFQQRAVSRLKKKCCLQQHLNQRHQREKEKLRAENRKLKNEYEEREAKIHELTYWADGFGRQVSKQVEQLHEFEEKIYTATNIIDDTLNVCIFRHGVT